MLQPQKNTFWEKESESWKTNDSCLPSINLSFKIETGWDNRVVKSILEARNVNDVSMYLWFIQYRIIFFKKTQWKKNNSKCRNFTIKKTKILGLPYSSNLELIIEITAIFLLALRFKPIT